MSGMRTPTRSPQPYASPSRHCATASANPRSSPPWPAAGYRIDTQSDTLADQPTGLDGVIVERAIERGEIDAATEPTQVIEAVIGPIHLRLLLTGRPVDDTFLERTVDTVINGIHQAPEHP
jgi:hypothetical protein